MGNPNQAPDERFTYRHYKTWPDSERWELIEGHAWAMSPAPMTRHQEMQARLITEIRLFLRGKPCKAYDAPFDVLLPQMDESEDDVDTVVQPDLSVFCDRTKITERGARGAPDLVMEILSPSTSKKDLNDKFRLYEKHGVREYWVIDPAACHLSPGCPGWLHPRPQGTLRGLRLKKLNRRGGESGNRSSGHAPSLNFGNEGD